MKTIPFVVFSEKHISQVSSVETMLREAIPVATAAHQEVFGERYSPNSVVTQRREQK